MTKLSPKAMRYVDMAMRDIPSMDTKTIWSAADRDPSKDLPEHVAKAALVALAHFEQSVRERLRVAIREDEVSDLSNDLGVILAIERDLRKGHPDYGNMAEWSALAG